MKPKRIPEEVRDALLACGFNDEAIDALPADCAFREYCEWHGLVGWGGQLWSVAMSLVGVEDK